jgi:hypothetical protein
MHVPGLSWLALHSLPAEQWHTMDVHHQRCMFPCSRAIAYAQRLLLRRRTARMAAFLERLERQSNPSLTPENTRVYPAAASYRVRKGDHLVVMVGGTRTGFAHHGIAIGKEGEDGSRLVADFSHAGEGVDTRGNKLRISTLEQFIGGRACFGVVPYESGPDEGLRRRRAVDLAKLMVKMDAAGQLAQYDLLRWNCETFAGVCVTGVWMPSQQAMRLLQAIQNDLRQGEESLVMQAAAVSSGVLMVAMRAVRRMMGL